jgi:NAD+ diphosphatase
MIHEISPHHFDNQYIPNQNITENDFIIHYNGNSLLLKTRGDEFELPQKKDFPEISESSDHTFLFTLNKTSCFIVWDDLKKHSSDIIYKDISFFRTARQKEIAWVTIAGLHLMNWYVQNRFCGKCGAKTHHKEDERAILCSECSTTVFPKISPAIIVAIVCNDKILLARNTNFPVSWYSLIAGYADIGESLEETVRREVKEEVGLDVKNIRYYKSQPWPLTGSLMVGFIAEADDAQLITVDTKELAEASWFTRGNIPNHPPKLSIAGEMIEKFEMGEI